jgi:hypothetical protein
MNEEYGFFSKNDNKREIIGKVKSTSKRNAIELFARIKNLTIDIFKSLYYVIKIR